MQITTKPRRIKPAHLMCGQPIWGLAGVLSCAYLAYLSWGHVRHCCLRECGHRRFTQRFEAEHPIMPKLRSMPDAMAELVPDGASVALGLQMEQMIPFAAGHEIIRQKKRGLTLIGPISDILFD